MIEAGEVSALYAYSLSRLSRSISDFAALAELCIEHKVPMRLAADQQLDFTSASGRFVINVLVSIAQMERELASERSKDTVAVRRARGDRIGHPFYGERDGEDGGRPGGLQGRWQRHRRRSAAQRAGSADQAGPAVVHDDRARDAAPPQRAAAPQAARCQERRALHPVPPGEVPLWAPDERQPLHDHGRHEDEDLHQVVYRCLAGRTTAEHGRLNVSESKLLPWVKAEAARFRIPFEQVEVRSATSRGGSSWWHVGSG